MLLFSVPHASRPSAFKALAIAGLVALTQTPLSALSAQAGADRLAVGGFVRERMAPDVGLPETQVSTVAQTPDGYFWLGTRRGLVRYDGLGATLFTPLNTPALRSWSVNALTVDDRGTLWISTDRGLTALERGTFRAIAEEQIPLTTVWKVTRDRRGRVWVAGSFGVRVGDGSRFTGVPHFDEHIYAVVEDARGRMWMGGRQVLASYAVGDTAPIRWPGTNGRRIYDLLPARDGTLWIALREGVERLDVSDPGHIRSIQSIATALGRVRAQVWTLALGADDALWMGTDTRGVLRWHDGTLTPLEPQARGTPDPVWWLMRDRRNSMWAGTSGGLLRYRRTPFQTLTRGLAAVGSWAVRGDRDGTPWLATDDGQVSWFDGSAWHPMFKDLANRTAASIWPLADGGVLVADDDEHLWRLTRQSVTDVTARFGISDAAPYGVFEDSDGAILSNTASGLLRSRNGRIDTLYRALGLSTDDTPRVMMRNAAGELVVGGPYVTIGEGRTRRRIGPADGLTDPNVTAIFESDGVLWIATADSGLFVLRGKHVTPLHRTNRRLNRGINGIVADGHGSLWLTSRSGLMRASVRDLLRAADTPGRAVAVREFDRADGLPTTDINSDYQSQIYRDRSGRIWLPTYAGPVLFDPAAVIVDSVPPEVHIQSVAVDGNVQDRSDSVRTLRHPGRVEVTFAVTDAMIPSRVRAEYRVMGIGDQWIDAGRRRTVTFGPLGGGAYRLEVRVAGEDGNWQPSIAMVTVVVPKSLTEQPWFFPLLATLAGVLAFGFTRWRLASARARERELSALVSQRTADLEASRADLEVRVAERSAALSRELAERYRLEQRLESARRMASLGRMAGGVSHEINNALSTVLGFAQLAQLASKTDERLHADLSEVVRAGRRAASITHQLLAFARQHHTALVATSVDDVIRDNLRSLEQLSAPLHVEHRRLAPTPLVDADAGQMEQLLVNLVKNARDSRPTDGRIIIESDARTLSAATAVGDRVLPAGRYALITVRDRGTGIAREALEHLFEPFFTTKSVNEGTGLGLAVVLGIVARHDGAIEVSSAVGEGTSICVWIPERNSAVVTSDADEETEGQGETILLAEDDAGIRSFATRMLREHGYRVLDAEDGAAALALVGKAIERIDLVLTDVLMPNANGLELARLLRAARPGLPVVFMTGYAGLDDAALSELRGTGPILAKPFTQDTLLRAVRHALEAAAR